MKIMKLGNRTFATKKQAKEFVSLYLKCNDDISDDDKIWIIDLFKKHPRWNVKSNDLKDIVIMKSNRGHNSFHLIKIMVISKILVI